MIAQGQGDHRLHDWDGANANTGIVASLGDNGGIIQVFINGFAFF